MFKKSGQVITKNPDIVSLIFLLFVRLIYNLWGKLPIYPTELSREPFYLTEGISIWPTIILRLIALILSIIFIIVSFRSLQNSCEELSSEFNLAGYPKYPYQSWRENLINWRRRRVQQIQKLWEWIRNLPNIIKNLINYIVMDREERINTSATVDTLWEKYIYDGKFSRAFWRTVILVMFYLILIFVLHFYHALPHSLYYF